MVGSKDDDMRDAKVSEFFHPLLPLLQLSLADKGRGIKVEVKVSDKEATTSRLCVCLSTQHKLLLLQISLCFHNGHALA